uniref:Brain protein I3 n=1 Tax=Lynx canadensis TaxID=61383 RepID=A0A667HNX6_LYNCA
MDHKPLLQERPPAYNLEAGQGDFACGPHGYGAIPAAPPPPPYPYLVTGAPGGRGRGGGPGANFGLRAVATFNPETNFSPDAAAAGGAARPCSAGGGGGVPARVLPRSLPGAGNASRCGRGRRVRLPQRDPAVRPSAYPGAAGGWGGIREHQAGSSRDAPRPSCQLTSLTRCRLQVSTRSSPSRALGEGGCRLDFGKDKWGEVGGKGRSSPHASQISSLPPSHVPSCPQGYPPTTPGSTTSTVEMSPGTLPIPSLSLEAARSAEIQEFL